MLNVDNPFKSPAILSYCTGFRGLERGIERAIGATRTAVYVEIEAFIIENLLAGMEKGVLAPAPIWPNIKTFDARPFCGKIHGIIGGYPCQPFSNAGNRKGTEDPRHLYPYLERDIKAVRPVWCFFENVGGHLSLGFDEVYRSLSGMGYNVEAGLYTAAEAGAPHERERLFILAIRRDWLADTRLQRQAINEQPTAGIKQCGKGAGELADTMCSGSGREIRETCRGVGRQDVRQGNGTECAVCAGATGADGELADTDHAGGRTPASGNNALRSQEGRRRVGNTQPEPCRQCKELAQPDSERHFYWEPKEQPAERGQHALCNAATGGEGMDDTCNQGLQGCKWCGAFCRERDATCRPATKCGGTQWPARPGEPQYGWEKPRTVKPGMGSTINGYNFREDLLRAYGNSVVEQTAEIAMIDLLQKHGL